MKSAKKKTSSRPDPFSLPELPEPTLPLAEKPWGIVVAGVGGTGVITIGQLLGMAAHLEGKGIVTQDSAGLAQKGGATWSHIQIANRMEAINTTKVGTAEADLVIACDPIVGANQATLAVLREQRSYVALNSHSTPTAAFVHNPDWQSPAGQCEGLISAAVGAGQLGSFDADHLAVKLLGDSLYTNPLLLGYAWQMGKLPLSLAALTRAIELNGVQIDNNKAAFAWGRRAAVDLAAVQAIAGANSAGEKVVQIVRKPGLDQMVSTRVEFLTDYQDTAYAQQYRSFVDKVRAAEAALGAGEKLSEAVARYLFKLMAYKDEYEVARLHTDRRFVERIAEQFEGDYKLVHHLAPPLLGKTNAQGEPVKQAFGPWMRTAFGVMAKMKGLRGGALDIFGRTEERRNERALIVEYRSTIEELLSGLTASNLGAAAEIARLPEQIRGYGHVKARHLAAVRPKWATLMAQWRQPAVKAAA